MRFVHLILKATVLNPLKVVVLDKILSIIVKVPIGINPIPPIAIEVIKPAPVNNAIKLPTILTIESLLPHEFLT